MVISWSCLFHSLVDSGMSGLVTNGNSGGSRPGTPCSTASGETGTNIKV